MSQERSTLRPFRDPAPKANGTLARQRPLSRLHGARGVSQRRPRACELTVVHTRLAEPTSVLNRAGICIVHSSTRDPGSGIKKHLSSLLLRTAGVDGGASGEGKPSGVRAPGRLKGPVTHACMYAPKLARCTYLPGPGPEGQAGHGVVPVAFLSAKTSLVGEGDRVSHCKSVIEGE